MVRVWACAAALVAMVTFGSARAEEVVTEYEGFRLVADATLAEGKTWADGAVLMVHGTLAHKDQETIATMRRLLNERGHNTLALNLSLGVQERRGPFDCAIRQVHYHRQALLEIGVWLTWLQEQGAKKVALFGHSRGGNQVAWYAFEKPKVELVGPVVLLAPMTWDQKRAAEQYRARYGHGFEEALETAGAMVMRGNGHKMLEGRHDLLYCPQAEVSAQAFFEYYSNDLRKDTPSILPGVDRPVLVVAASEDEVVPELVDKVRARKLKHVELEVIDGAGHFFRDLYAEDAADAIAKFLDRHMTPAGQGG